MLTSRKIVSVKSFTQPGGILFENPLAIRFVLPPSYFKIQFFLKHTVSVQLLSMGYVAIPLILVLKYYAETKKMLWLYLVQSNYKNGIAEVANGSLPMMSFER